jgi:hypothetical protein
LLGIGFHNYSRVSVTDPSCGVKKS